jgi:hypothetical protein
MAGDTTNLEKQAGQAAARNLGRVVRKTLKQHFSKDTGRMFRTNATAKMRHGSLDRIEIRSPYYSFIQHYGFSRSYKSGKTHQSSGTDHFNEALNNTSIIEELADKIAAIRIDNVTSIIKF